jgi:predicted kinase
LTLCIPIGIPGCGKSFYGVSNFESDAIVSPDRFRELLTGNKANQEVSGKAWALTTEIAVTRLAYNLDVYVDATNLDRKWYQKILDQAVFKHRPVEFIVFFVPHETSRKRNSVRPKAVPDHVMDKMIQRFEQVNTAELLTLGTVKYIY